MSTACWSYGVHGHRFPDGQELFTWSVLGPVGDGTYVTFQGSGVAATEERAIELAVAYITERGGVTTYDVRSHWEVRHDEHACWARRTRARLPGGGPTGRHP